MSSINLLLNPNDIDDEDEGNTSNLQDTAIEQATNSEVTEQIYGNKNIGNTALNDGIDEITVVEMGTANIENMVQTNSNGEQSIFDTPNGLLPIFT